MPTDETTRLRIRQYLTELMDEEAADAMMESMAPMPWTELATKDDLARLEARFDQRFDGIDQRFDGIDQRFEVMEQRFADRFDVMDQRFDVMGRQFDALVATITGNMVGLEGRLAMRFTESVRVILFAVLLLMTGVITAVITTAG